MTHELDAIRARVKEAQRQWAIIDGPISSRGAEAYQELQDIGYDFYIADTSALLSEVERLAALADSLRNQRTTDQTEIARLADRIAALESITPPDMLAWINRPVDINREAGEGE